ncbi:hypothetical protein ACS0TY_013713 [Phlomoides rotata]
MRHKLLRAPQSRINKGMSLDDFKFIYWMEYGHRMWGRALGIMFALPFSYFLRKGYITPRLGLKLSGLFALGAGQGLIGWWMVKSGLEKLSATATATSPPSPSSNLRLPLPLDYRRRRGTNRASLSPPCRRHRTSLTTEPPKSSPHNPYPLSPPRPPPIDGSPYTPTAVVIVPLPPSIRLPHHRIDSYFGPNLKPPKASSKPSSSNPEELEIEITEVLEIVVSGFVKKIHFEDLEITRVCILIFFLVYCWN